MFSCTHSFLLVLLVITCFHSYTAGNDEFMTQFCLNMDTAEHMDSSTVQGRKNSTHVSYLATKSPVQQDYTEEQLHTVTSHGIANDSQQLRQAQEDPDPIREGQEDPDPIREGQEDPDPITEGQEDPDPIRDAQEDPDPIREGQEDPHPVREGQEDPHPFRKGQEDPHPVRKFQEDPHTFWKAALCCSEFHKRPIPAAKLVSYEETRFDCTLPGVILTTKKGYRICADPEEDWVKQITANKNLAKTLATN